MGLQLILGSSGTGKTTKIYNDMLQKSSIDKDRKYLAVVPEQFTMETQKIIVELSPGHGTMDIDILSFDRLAKRIFDEAGMNTLEVLDDTGKCLIIRKIIEENKNRLTVFGSKVKMSGFIDEMKSLVSELYQYGIGEKELDEMLVKSTKKPLLYAKLEDIRLIMVELKKYLEDNGVDVNHALELLGDMDMYNMTINDFMAEVESKWARINEYKNTNNMPDYAIEVHSLKSDCKYLGFMTLADIAYQHELKSKENDSSFVNEHFDELAKEYNNVLEIAKNYTEHNPVAP